MAATGWGLYQPPFSSMYLFGFAEELAKLEMRVGQLCLHVLLSKIHLGCDLFKIILAEWPRNC